MSATCGTDRSSVRLHVRTIRRSQGSPFLTQGSARPPRWTGSRRGHHSVRRVGESARGSARQAVPATGPLVHPRIVIGRKAHGLRARRDVLSEVGGCWVSVSRRRGRHEEQAQKKGQQDVRCFSHRSSPWSVGPSGGRLTSRLDVGVAAGQGRWSRDLGPGDRRVARGGRPPGGSSVVAGRDTSPSAGCRRPGGRAPPVGAESGVRF